MWLCYPVCRKVTARSLCNVTVANDCPIDNHLQGCTSIAALYRGHVLEQGTHADLLATGGYYRHLWEASGGRQDKVDIVHKAGEMPAASQVAVLPVGDQARDGCRIVDAVVASEQPAAFISAVAVELKQPLLGCAAAPLSQQPVAPPVGQAKNMDIPVIQQQKEVSAAELTAVAGSSVSDSRQRQRQRQQQQQQQQQPAALPAAEAMASISAVQMQLFSPAANAVARASSAAIPTSAPSLLVAADSGGATAPGQPATEPTKQKLRVPPGRKPPQLPTQVQKTGINSMMQKQTVPVAAERRQAVPAESSAKPAIKPAAKPAAVGSPKPAGSIGNKPAANQAVKATAKPLVTSSSAVTFPSSLYSTTTLSSLGFKVVRNTAFKE